MNKRFEEERFPTPQEEVSFVQETLEDRVQAALQRIAHAHEGNEATRTRLYTPYTQFFEANRDRVLDVGCGDGLWVHLLHKAGISAAGIDSDPAVEELCAAHGVFNPYLGKVPDDLPSDHNFNALTLFHIIEHLTPYEAMKILMTPDIDKIMVITPNTEHQRSMAGFWKDITHVRPYPSDLIATMLREASFNNITQGTQHEDGWDTVVFAQKLPEQAK